MGTAANKSILAATPARPVLVLGGGIAGLTTALELQRRGVPVRVIEPNPTAGGRIRSDREGTGTLENGMQFYYSGYKQTKRLLAEHGLLGDLVKIPVSGLLYWEGKTGRFSKSFPWLGLMSVAENLKLEAACARQLWPLLQMDVFNYAANEPLGDVDAAKYFLDRGGERVLELAIRPMVNSYAFTEPEGHSLAMLLRILKLGGTATTYGLKGGNASLPRAMAARLDVLTAAAKRVVVERGRVSAVVIEREGREEILPCSHVVSALQAPVAAQVLTELPELSRALDALSYSSIVLANLHLDRPLTGRDWVWVHSRKAGHQAAFATDLTRRVPAMFDNQNSVIQVNFHSPRAHVLARQGDDLVIAQAMADMAAFLPDIATQVVRTSVVKRERALPNFPVGMFQQVRALQGLAAEVDGLQLAGDYLRSPLCEGAVQSGLAAVNEALGGHVSGRASVRALGPVRAPAEPSAGAL